VVDIRAAGRFYTEPILMGKAHVFEKVMEYLIVLLEKKGT